MVNKDRDEGAERGEGEKGKRFGDTTSKRWRIQRELGPGSEVRTYRDMRGRESQKESYLVLVASEANIL